MTRNRFLILCSAAALSASVLTGCEAEEDSCETDADCGEGFVCQGATPDEPGTCVEQTTPEGTPCTDDSACTGGYLCDAAASLCFEGCTEAAVECASGFQCDGADDAAGTLGTCNEIPMEPYTVAIVTSEVAPTADEINDTNTPGPDVDFISLTSGNQVLSPVVTSSVHGAIGDENATNGVNGITAQDAMSGAGPTFECDPNDGDTYWSMGANDGFFAVTFGAGQEMIDGDIISVYELSRTSCSSGVSTEWVDSYAIYIHNGTVPATATEIRGAACAQGVSGADGGFTQATVSLAACGQM